MRNTLLTSLAVGVLGACSSEGLGDEPLALLAQEQQTCPAFDRASIWRPAKGATWDLQLSGRVDTSADVDVYDIDAEANSAALIERLHREGRKVVCYINAGAWEPYRSDSHLFPAEILGNPWSTTKFADEKWIDIRRLDLLKPLIAARFDMAKKKGCDAIDPDNVDGFDDAGSRTGDRTGFNLSHADQLRFNRFLACEAHTRGMAIGLKNNPSQAKDLQADFDFVVSEQCMDYGECGAFKSFLTAGKPVFLAEYQEDLAPDAERKFDQMCAETERQGISAILKKNALDSWRHACPSERAAAAAASSNAPKAP
jgi:hypothetical protein